jgi:hypothetical protein
MLMPETAVNQDHGPSSGKHKIGPARQVSPVEPEPETESMNEAAHSDFRSCVSAADPPHVFTPPRGVEPVH